MSNKLYGTKPHFLSKRIHYSSKAVKKKKITLSNNRNHHVYTTKFNLYVVDLTRIEWAMIQACKQIGINIEDYQKMK